MEIEGAVAGRNTAKVTLARPSGESLVLTLQAFPLGFTEQLEMWIPSPSPPQDGFLRGDDRKLLKDNTGRPIAKYDAQNADYLAEDRKVKRLQNALAVAESLEADPRVKFTAKANRNRMREYAEGILAELEAFGFSEADLGMLLTGVLKASSVTAARLMRLREDFLPETQARERSMTE